MEGSWTDVEFFVTWAYWKISDKFQRAPVFLFDYRWKSVKSDPLTYSAPSNDYVSSYFQKLSGSIRPVLNTG